MMQLKRKQEEARQREIEEKKASSGQKTTREESQPKMTEAELAMEEKLRVAVSIVVISLTQIC